MNDGIIVRALREDDIAGADHIFRLAFGTWFGAPHPPTFFGDRALVASRWRNYPDGGVVAERHDTIVGLGFASRWGSLGVLGPIAVLPELWRHGVARRLVGPTVDIIDGWGCRLAGLFTFPQSATHLRLYQHFGFWPRSLTPVMAKPVAATTESASRTDVLSAATERAARIAACAALMDAVFAGLDLTREIIGIIDQGLGDVVLLREGADIAGFAICHSGKGSEGGSADCYIKFALVRSGDGAPRRFAQLVAGCEEYARSRGVTQLSAGVATARIGAYRTLLDLGFQARIVGVAMHRPWQDAYDRPDIYAIDDWR